MFFPSVLSRLMLALVLLVLSKKTNSAPTHHLTIGVQGNTPTLMVTSSEIGITAQTVGFNKKPAKVLYSAKALRDPDLAKKAMKTKSYKNAALNNKKDKSQYLIKSSFKHELQEEKAYTTSKTLEHEEIKKETFSERILLNTKEEQINLQTTTASIAVSATPKEEQNHETSVQSTSTLPPKHINEIPLRSATTTQTTTNPTTTKSLEEISTPLSSASADTSSHPHFAITDNDDLNISLAVSATLSPKHLTTLNNNDDTNTAATERTSSQTQTATGPNDVVVVAQQTHKTTQISTEPRTTKIANEDDSDRYTQESTAITDNENLLLTTIATNAFTTPTAAADDDDISTPSTASLETNNAEAAITTKEMLVLSLIATTTENVADDNNNSNSQEEQQQPIATNMSHGTPVKGMTEEGKAKHAANPIKQKHQRDNVVMKSRQVDTSTTLETRQVTDDVKSTENPLERPTEQSNRNAHLSATENKFSENKIKTASDVTMHTTAATRHFLRTEHEQPKPEFQATSAATETPESTIEPSRAPTTTTETILKLIDLEKHVLKTIDDLKQPSLLMAAPHDNGHDGVKTTKKKQLIDKHYVEALLHQKQDVHRKDFSDTPVTNASQPTVRSHMPLLKTVEHGSLGPILMQEKTFHVMHQNDEDQKMKQHYKEDTITSQLRRGHFVELKAQPVGNENLEKKITMPSKILNSFQKEREEIIHMQADQPAGNLQQNIMKQIKENKDKQNATSILKGPILDLEKSKLFENTSNENKRMLQHQENSNKLQKPDGIPKESIELKQNKHALETLSFTDVKLHSPVLENQQQAVTKSFSAEAIHETSSKIKQAKSPEQDKNPSQLMNDLKATETSDRNHSSREAKMLFETNSNIEESKNSPAIQKSATFENALEVAALKLEQKSPIQHTQSVPTRFFEVDRNVIQKANTDKAKQENPQTFNGLEASEKLQPTGEEEAKPAPVLSTTVFQVIDSVTTKIPIMQAETFFTTQQAKEKTYSAKEEQKIESKISDIQIEVYDSTVDSIAGSTNFKDIEAGQQNSFQQYDDNYLGKTTKPPIATVQQERFTQYVIDRTETSTHDPINYNTIKVAAGKPEPAAIEIHINVSESFGNESEDLEFSYPQTEFGNNQQIEKAGEESYDGSKVGDNIKLKIPSNQNNNVKDARHDEILVVEIIDTDNNTADTSRTGSKSNKVADELFITDVKHIYTTPPPPPPPPPYQTNFDRDSDTIFYISNTEVKVGESLPSAKNLNEERKLKLESQFFPANYMASTHPNVNNNEDTNPHPSHHLYEEDIILSSNRNQADSLKIYRNNNEPSPPLDVTYVGESIIEVEQSPDGGAATTYAPDQMHNVATPQPDVIIQPAILPEISIGVPVIGELPPQIELKEIDFMPSEAQLRRSGIYDDNDNGNSNSNNDIDDNTITGGSSSNNNNHDVDAVSGNSNSNQHLDESSIQYGGDLIDESADGGFDGVEGSYPFGNPALVKKSFLPSSSSSSSSSYSTAFLTRIQKQQQQQQQQQPNHVADYAHLYINYGVNNMRKDELTADVKDSGEMFLNVNVGAGNANVASSEQNTTSFKDFLSKASMSNATMQFAPANATQNERMSNATAFSVMEDANDLEDRNTENIINLISLAIGLFIVILPVVVTCSMFWALRYLYKKYHPNTTDDAGYGDSDERKLPLTEDGVEKGEFVHETSSSPTNSHKDTIHKYPDTSNKPSSTDSSVKFSSEYPIPNIETSSSNTHATLAANYPSAFASQKNEALKLSLALSSPMTQKYAKPFPTASSPPSKSTASEQTHCEHDGIFSGERDDGDVEMPGPNGSITKMTLENNLLIVETEERNDISRVARETKMDYNKDGVFVVEVARGIDSKTIPESPVAEGNDKMLSMFDTKQNNGGLGYKLANEKNCSNNEKVQIHSPPPENQEEGPRSLHQIEEVEEPINSPHLNENTSEGNGLAYRANTGLSQSDLSTTSSSDSNKGYCYGNQELYVVEQTGYSPVAPNGNMVLKCDIKDLKDDDRNPGNDHYLKHSPDKKEDLSNGKEDAVETTKKPREEECRTSSGESPEQKQNDKNQGKNDSNKIARESSLEMLEKQDCDSSSIVGDSIKTASEDFNSEAKNGLEATCNKSTHTPDIAIPVEIEVHIIPTLAEDMKDEQQLSLKDQSDPQHLTSVDGHAVLTDSAAEKSSGQEVIGNCLATDTNLLNTIESDCKDMQASDDSNVNEENKHLSIEHTDTIDENPVTEATDGQLKEKPNQHDKKAAAEEENFERPRSSLEKETNVQQPETINGKPLTEEHFKEMETQNDEEFEEPNSLSSREMNGVSENKEPHLLTIADVNGAVPNHTEIDQRELMADEENLLPQEIEPVLVKAITTVGSAPEIEPRLQKLLNGHTDTESIHNSLNEIENGYDSLISLPEPPPTTDEPLNSDISEQQLDSLPPPPPPEVFSLKDLPPPLTNGNVDSPQSEESNSFYNTLPPPPPTTLEVTASAETTTTSNGKVHASPLTPPASPPAHFTNNLHAGLCSQPIAVDVNGS